jgi:hypothetical protein
MQLGSGWKRWPSGHGRLSSEGAKLTLSNSAMQRVSAATGALINSRAG